MTLTATQTTNNLQQFHDGFKPAEYPTDTEGGFRKQDQLQKKLDRIWYSACAPKKICRIVPA